MPYPRPLRSIQPSRRPASNREPKRRSWLRTFGPTVVAAGLIATACTNSDTTEASLDDLNATTTTELDNGSSETSTNPDGGSGVDALVLDGSDQRHTNHEGSFVEQPVADDPYWSGQSANETPTTQNSATTATTQSGSLGTKPKTLAFTEREYAVPEKSYVATVIGEGVSSLERPAPGAATNWFPNPTQFGNDRVFLVLDDTTSDDYVKISLPIRPNGQEGWIPRDSVTISEVEHYAVVDLTNDALTVWDGDDIIVQTKAVTGKASTPTPVGNFFVRDIIERDNPGGAYGPYIIALSAFSEVLETFAGGLPAVAIHGTNKPWLIGGEHSSGCIRIPNDLIRQLAASVPPGTPVTILN